MDSIKIEINNIHLLLIYLIFVPPTPLCGGGCKSAVLCSVVSAVCGCLDRCQWRPPPRPDHTNKQHTQHLNISIYLDIL